MFTFSQGIYSEYQGLIASDKLHCCSIQFLYYIVVDYVRLKTNKENFNFLFLKGVLRLLTRGGQLEKQLGNFQYFGKLVTENRWLLMEVRLYHIISQFTILVMYCTITFISLRKVLLLLALTT